MSKTYFTAEIDVEVLEDLSKIYDTPLLERTESQKTLKHTLLTQIGLVALAQYGDRDDD